ncbi:MAG: FAD:protein FMN transferase [Bifidobacteriaceae bacterium]|jgi:thiamine biosynthesis lipoprotein|nr:FAD:protein FMN transferase [Bifidobacteriaceae bacterium]
MGTLVEATARFPAAAPAPSAARLDSALRSLIGEVEGQLSRFLPDSDVARLARAAGAWTPVGEHTLAVLGAALAAREATEGLFDPAPPGRDLGLMAGSAQARVEPPGGLDFGAIGKGYAADQALRLCLALGAEAALVAVGVSSISFHAPDGRRPWRIGVRAPGGGRREALGVLSLVTGAVATSSLDEQPGHIWDPRQEAPSSRADEAVGREAPDSFCLATSTLRDGAARRICQLSSAAVPAAAVDMAQATVVAPDGMTAEACSTALMLGGIPLAARLTDRLPDAAAVLVTTETVLVSAALRDAFTPGAQQRHS